MSSKITKKELMSKLKVLDIQDKETRNSVVCGLIGHSRIQTACFGYYYCARCGNQLGDTLCSIYPGAEDAVVVGHNCKTCRKNYKTLTWRDKLYCPNPFKEKTK